MVVTLNSSQAQQNFGQTIAYQRYQRLAAAEQELLRTRLQQASTAATARAAHLTDAEIDALIERARTEVNET